MAVDLNYYKKKDIHSLYISLGFLAFVILWTLGLFFYNGYMENKNITLEEKLTWIETSVTELRSEKDIQSYEIYSQNKAVFERMQKYSQISPMIENLTGIMLKYDLVFKSFNYSEGKINLEAYSETIGSPAYKKVVKFIEDYEILPEALFTLGDINTYTGYEKIDFPLSFQLK